MVRSHSVEDRIVLIGLGVFLGTALLLRTRAVRATRRAAAVRDGDTSRFAHSARVTPLGAVTRSRSGAGTQAA
jgi:hypothetical protein